MTYRDYFRVYVVVTYYCSSGCFISWYIRKYGYTWIHLESIFKILCILGSWWVLWWMHVEVPCVVVGIPESAWLFHPGKLQCPCGLLADTWRKTSWSIRLHWWKVKLLPRESWNSDPQVPSFWGKYKIQDLY